MKGQLVRSILFPKNNNFQFYRDSFKILGGMAIVAIFGFILAMVTLFEQNAETIYIVKKSLDIITVVVPPALPTCMAVGISFALIRFYFYSLTIF
jgi:cation-transporting ATPase 13A2